MAQTTYDDSPRAYFVGDVVNREGGGFGGRTRSADLIAAAIVLAPGLGCVRDTANGDRAVKLPAGAGTFAGIVFQDHTNPATDGDSVEFSTGDTVSIAVDGGGCVVTVEPTENVDPTLPVYLRHTTDGVSDPGTFTVNADETAGVARVQTLTLSGALDGGRRRIQLLTFNQDLVAAETVDLTINGDAIPQVTFAADHATTMGIVRDAIALTLAGQGVDAAVVLSDAGGANRVIRIASLDETSPTSEAIAAIVIGTVGGLTLTQSDEQAGLAAHGLTVDVDATTIAVDWQGSEAATIAAFVEALDDSAAVLSADWTAPLVVTLTAATASPTACALTNAAAPGGLVARTLTAAQTVAGVAAVAAKAQLVTGAQWLDTVTAGNPARVWLR
jgi:hypothetical protein